MTREQILSMTAQELAEATAVHVMGWEMDIISGIATCWTQGDEIVRDIEEWNPAECIRDSLELLERFDSHQCTKMHNVGSEKETMFRVIVKSNKHVAYGESLPLAASRAALLAVKGL